MGGGWWVVGGGWWTFFVFKTNDKKMFYSRGIDVYIYAKGIIAEQKFYGFKNFYKLETSPHENQNPNIQDDFLKIEYKSNYKG